MTSSGHPARQRADMLLVARGFFESRARAQEAIAAGLVQADGAVLRKASQMLTSDAAIVAEAAHPYVSRGGVKLAAALDHFAIDPQGMIAADIGSSTGGFSEVLLLRGAKKVYAVDSGRDQLHARLHREPRLVSMEQTDARRLDAGLIGEPLDLIVSDVSFISLKQALPAALKLARAGALCVALIKPQFEVGRAEIGKGGIVKDEAAQARACTAIEEFFVSLGWHNLGLIPSPIPGGDGNREFLIAARKIV